ncbi:MAG: hypothetical protein ACN6P1_04290 [Pseudomonas sp.]|uniref:hypothetical protein n=1 Tax=Pseudomonas sp. TaxID=306 RepID=UPI003D0DC401
MKTSLRPDPTVQKLLISSPSSFVGEFENDFLLVTHAWPDRSTRRLRTSHSEGPASRSAYIVAFKTEPHEIKPGVMVPDYSAVGPMICAYFSVLFGKRFDFHGLIEGSGYFNIPAMSEYYSLSDHKLSHNSHVPRKGVSIPLNLIEVERLLPLLTVNALDAGVVRVFQFAARFYLQALQTYESDAEVAYLHLITSAEIISNSSFYDERELLDKEIIEALERISSELDGGERIARAIRSRLYSVRRRFVKTLTGLLSEPFFQGYETDEGWMALRKDCISRRLLAAYDLRSKYVHAGTDFGTWVSSGGRWEVQMGKPVVEDKEFAKLLHRAPTFMGMERVLRYALLHYLHRSGAPMHSCFAVEI